jgi:glutathione peroxidase
MDPRRSVPDDCAPASALRGGRNARRAGLLLCLGLLMAATVAATWAAEPPPAVAAAQGEGAPVVCPKVLSYTAPRLQDDRIQDLCQYAGKVVLVVNTASKCGFTPQYDGLEALYARYAGRGLVVLGFPSNDFGGQEPGGKGEIAATCYDTYGVKFPMFGKIRVVGPDAHPLYVDLARVTGTAPKWNFHKYLIARDGKVVASLPSSVEPLSATLTRRIEQLL